MKVNIFSFVSLYIKCEVLRLLFKPKIFLTTSTQQNKPDVMIIHARTILYDNIIVPNIFLIIAPLSRKCLGKNSPCRAKLYFLGQEETVENFYKKKYSSDFRVFHAILEAFMRKKFSEMFFLTNRMWFENIKREILFQLHLAFFVCQMKTWFQFFTF